MIALFQEFMAHPIRGIVAVLCAVSLATHLGLTEVRLAQATLIEQQLTDKAVNVLVIEMQETLIRIDENVKILKESKHAN